MSLLMLLFLTGAVGASEVMLPDDQVVFVRQGELWTFRFDGQGLRQLTRTGSRKSRPAASPDGTAIAYESYDTQRSEYSLWTCSADGGNANSVMTGARYATWSPDGGRLLFAMQRRGSLDIWMSSRAGNDLRRITDTKEQEYLPVWSPDGDRVAFVREIVESSVKRYQVIVRDLNGKETEWLTLGSRGITSLSWAPAERLLIGSRSEGTGGSERLFVAQPGEAKLTEVDPGLSSNLLGCWTGSGDGLVCVESRRNTTRLVARTTTARAEPLKVTADGDNEPAVLPGRAHRVPQIYVLGRRSFYLPLARWHGEEALVPAADLARQLRVQLRQDGDKLTLKSPQDTVLIDLAAQEISSEGANASARKALATPTQRVSERPLVPLRETAARLGFRSEWSAETRILRVGG